MGGAWMEQDGKGKTKWRGFPLSSPRLRVPFPPPPNPPLLKLVLGGSDCGSRGRPEHSKGMLGLRGGLGDSLAECSMSPTLWPVYHRWWDEYLLYHAFWSDSNRWFLLFVLARGWDFLIVATSSGHMKLYPEPGSNNIYVENPSTSPQIFPSISTLTRLLLEFLSDIL